MYIGSFILSPNRTIQIYTKQYLHTGEELYFDTSMNYNPVIRIGNELISLAICADINNPCHPKDAKLKDVSIYIPSIFFSKDGIKDGLTKLQKYAKEFSLNILMSNFCGSHWGIESGGKSSFWNSKGKQLVELPDNTNGIILVEKNKNNWITSSYLLEKQNRA